MRAPGPMIAGPRTTLDSKHGARVGHHRPLDGRAAEVRGAVVGPDALEREAVALEQGVGVVPQSPPVGHLPRSHLASAAVEPVGEVLELVPGSRVHVARELRNARRRDGHAGGGAVVGERRLGAARPKVHHAASVAGRLVDEEDRLAVGRRLAAHERMEALAGEAVRQVQHERLVGEEVAERRQRGAHAARPDCAPAR